MPGPTKHRGGGRRQRPPERRKPPEEATGEERRFLNSRLKSGARLRIALIDGSSALAVVRSFSEDAIEIDTDERKGVMLSKSQIRSIEEVD